MTNNEKETVIVIIGNDKVGRRLVNLLQKKSFDHEIVLYLDGTSTYKRTLRLIRKGHITLTLVIKMFWAELNRPSCKIIKPGFIRSNLDLIQIVKSIQPSRIILFRAGLIVSKNTLALFNYFFNIHCAKVPEYGGLGAIQRALMKGDYQQYATLHKVTTTIDSGEIIDIKAYELNGAQSYRWNEDVAYSAGMELLIKHLKG